MNRNRYPVTEMCRFSKVSRSGYYDYVKCLDQPAHDAALADIIREQQKKCDKTYGYRRIWKWLEKYKKIHKKPKTILRIMKNTNFYLKFAAAESGDRWDINCTNMKIC